MSVSPSVSVMPSINPILFDGFSSNLAEMYIPTRQFTCNTNCTCTYFYLVSGQGHKGQTGHYSFIHFYEAVWSEVSPLKKTSSVNDNDNFEGSE